MKIINRFTGAVIFEGDFETVKRAVEAANLSGADLSEAVTPFEGDIRATINERVNQEGCALEMQSWHTCNTTHCIAGWAVIIHPQGLELEEKYGTSAAAALIFNASAVNPIPNFYASNEDAMAWLKDGKV